MIKTLSEKHPEIYANLKEVGRPSIAEMMTRFAQPVDIDKALGLDGVASHWVSGRNGASGMSERLAAEWLEKQDAITADPQAASSDGVFMVVCPADKAAKVSKVLDMMGCECVEI